MSERVTFSWPRVLPPSSALPCGRRGVGWAWIARFGLDKNHFFIFSVPGGNKPAQSLLVRGTEEARLVRGMACTRYGWRVRATTPPKARRANARNGRAVDHRSRCTRGRSVRWQIRKSGLPSTWSKCFAVMLSSRKNSMSVSPTSSRPPNSFSPLSKKICSPLLLRRDPICPPPPPPAPPITILPRTPESFRDSPAPAAAPLPRLPSLPLPAPSFAGVTALAHAGSCCLDARGAPAAAAAAASRRTPLDDETPPPLPAMICAPGRQAGQESATADKAVGGIGVTLVLMVKNLYKIERSIQLFRRRCQLSQISLDRSTNTTNRVTGIVHDISNLDREPFFAKQPPRCLNQDQQPRASTNAPKTKSGRRPGE